MILLMLALFVAEAPQLEPPTKDAEIIRQTATLKLIRGEHLTFYFTGEYFPAVKDLAFEAEAFLSELSSRWGVILPKERVEVLLLRTPPAPNAIQRRADPSWLFHEVDRRRKRVILRVIPPEKYEHAKALSALRYALVRVFLSFAAETPPRYLEEGLVRYYSARASGWDHFITVWWFSRTANMEGFLGNDKFFATPVGREEAGSVCRYLVDWLWSRDAGAEMLFMQTFLNQGTLTAALSQAGLPPRASLLSSFDQAVRPHFHWLQLFKSYYLWSLLLGVLTIIFALWRLVSAARIALMEHAGEIVAVNMDADTGLETRALVTPEMFSGPAFGKGGPEPVITKPRAPRQSGAEVAAVPTSDSSPHNEPKPFSNRHAGPPEEQPSSLSAEEPWLPPELPDLPAVQVKTASNAPSARKAVKPPPIAHKKLPFLQQPLLKPERPPSAKPKQPPSKRSNHPKPPPRPTQEPTNKQPKPPPRPTQEPTNKQPKHPPRPTQEPTNKQPKHPPLPSRKQPHPQKPSPQKVDHILDDLIFDDD